MEKFIIRGGIPLRGKVKISGAKNAAVAAIPAALLANDEVVLENLPMINDVRVFADIIQYMGARVSLTDDGVMRINPHINPANLPPYDLIKKLRASYYLLGVLLAKYGEATISMPGGCDIGTRPIDQHIKGFQAMGARIDIEHGMIKARAKQLVGAPIYLDVVSVGATINIMLAASMAKGTTIIENAAKEPHIVDIANFINAMGGNVKGAGTDVIKVTGVEHLHGCTHMVIPDQIEAGTFMIAAAAAGGDVIIDNIIPKHLDPITAKLVEAGATVEENGDHVRVISDGSLNQINVKTLPYPGFPTDLQQPMTSLLTIARGTSIITETVWESRFKHVDELKRMGANIKVEGSSAIIQGVKELSGAPVKATDLRAGAAMVIAGLIASGETEISCIHHIDRGYESIEKKLKEIGADIVRIKN
ncbi:UDP-N-acetylglucosamine 1-carboxyvinyltransferase 2 [Koleobacter methoxysyntrophicus]|uniref:UDP-N-acetylglucosamine 1-carboxyvinyltransferase n=1 Tax=Koleobacter methoxysyntrophicus TaxID=2751313 RepID=A0A8A0RMG1_9FIRM|nr:UDP-N-acetylglucosamine 1-carboxyvinyltransferase [Koleobacter methoxysyntrophicus]QSQ08709.1 UDP-N-acetylglucosamine 1-carboxyvinyltransferase 2 [Koleobacter methoxysyntrophicus]